MLVNQSTSTVSTEDAHLYGPVLHDSAADLHKLLP